MDRHGFEEAERVADALAELLRLRARAELRALHSRRWGVPHARIAAAQGRALARRVDSLATSKGGSAGLALASVSRRLDEVVASLRVQPKDAVTEIVEERAARRAALYGDQEVAGAAA